ncbi:MAG TPA: carbohydrate kinase family protein [Acidimicrobiales bacterium]|nr:carbohydrate kinase family protein [Acidimicrobiales bacterium]
MSTYVAIGSVCWDEVEGDDERRLGGSVLFSSRVAQAAGWDAHIVTSGTAELERALRAAMPEVKVTVQPSATDTVMAFSRAADLGPQTVPTVAEPLDLTRSPVDLGTADVVHLAPIMGEVTRELIAQVRGARFVGITPQGMLRTRDPVTHRLGLLDAPTAWWAEGSDAVVLSESEYARIAEPLAGPARAVAVTRGERGCFGTSGTEAVDLPGVPLDAISPAGTIGAGDVFAAALFVGLADGRSFGDAMDAANRRAAAHVGGRA